MPEIPHRPLPIRKKPPTSIPFSPRDFFDRLADQVVKRTLKAFRATGKALDYEAWARDPAGKAKTETKKFINDVVGFELFGPFFRQHPLWGLYGIVTNPPRFIAENWIVAPFLKGELFLKLGYETKTLFKASGFRERKDATGRIIGRDKIERWCDSLTQMDQFSQDIGLSGAERLRPARKPIAKVFGREIGPGLGGSTTTLQRVKPGGGAPAKLFRGLHRLSPINVIGGSTFRELGWDALPGIDSLGVETKVPRFPIPHPGRLARGSRFLYQLNPICWLDARYSPFRGWEGFKMPLPGFYDQLVSSSGELYSGPLPQVLPSGYPQGARQRVILTAGKADHLEILRERGGLGRVGRFIHEAHPAQWLRDGGSFERLGWRPVIQPGPIPHPKLGTVLRNIVRLEENPTTLGAIGRFLFRGHRWLGTGQFDGLIEAGWMRLGIHHIYRPGRRAFFNRLLYRLHPRNFGVRGMPLGLSGAFPRAGRVVQSIQLSRPVRWAGRQLIEGRTAVETAWKRVKSKIALWLLAHPRFHQLLLRLSSLGVNLITKIPLVGPLIRRIAGDPFVRFLGRSLLFLGRETFFWISSPGMQALRYTYNTAKFLFQHPLARLRDWQRRARNLMGGTPARITRGSFNLLRRGLGLAGQAVRAALSRLGVQIYLQGLRTLVVNAAGSLLSTILGGGAAAGSSTTIGAGTAVASGGVISGGGIAAIIVVVVILLAALVFIGRGVISGAFLKPPVEAIEAPELLLSKTVSPTQIRPDAPCVSSPPCAVTYSLQITNLGDQVAENVFVTDDAGTPENAADDIVFPRAGAGALNLEPGKKSPVYTYTQEITVTPGESKVISNLATGHARIEGASTTFSDVAYLFIGEGSIPPPAGAPTGAPPITPNSPPCGWPVEGRVSLLFGAKPPESPVEKSHTGIDIGTGRGAYARGQDVYSPVQGRITSAYWLDDCGGIIKIESVTGNFTTDFVHMSRGAVDGLEPGRDIYLGQNLGKTHQGPIADCSTGTHLHYRVRQDGNLLDPNRTQVVGKGLGERIPCSEAVPAYCAGAACP